MKKISLTFLLITYWLLTALVTPSFAGIDKLAQTGMPFLKLNASSRSSGMGGAYVAIGDDASSMFSNLGGLAFVESGADITINMTNWIVDTKHYAFGAAYGLKKWGTLGISFVYMDYGTFTETWPYDGTNPDLINLGYETGQDFTIAEFALGLSYARRISEKFSVGGQIKYAKQDLFETLMYHEVKGEELITQNVENVMALDFGTLYYTGFKDLRFGMSIRNFSGQGRYIEQRFEMPLDFRIGLAMDIMTLLSPGNESHKLTLALDALHPRDYSERIHVGAEYYLMDLLALRAGYKFNYDEESLAFGLGVKKDLGNMGMRIDYAYSALGDFFDPVHRVTINLSYK